MDSYSGFAQVYDMFMDNIPYDKWCKYIVSVLKSCGINDGIVCELGCGTGKMTRRLRDAGYDMIGIDDSAQMLQLAREKESDDSILYLMQDMREFELYGSVAAIVSVCDSMNYMTTPQDFTKVLKLAHNYLDPGGIMIFDINTAYYYKYVLGDNTFCENRDEGSFVWENFFNPKDNTNESYLTIYHKIERKEDELYKRYEEVHLRRGYTVSQVRKFIEKAQLKPVAVYEAYTKKTPTRTCERLCFVAKKEMD